MAEKMTRKEVSEQKVKLRGEIAELLAAIRAANRVPDRILNGADVMKTRAYKATLSLAKQKALGSYQRGSVEKLKEYRQRLDAMLREIT